MKSRRIILTNLNPSVYTQRYISTFLSELVINSLLYDEVLIREGDLITNRSITKYLRGDSEALAVFKELLATGAVKVLHLLPESYPSSLKFDPKHQPLRTRAEDHSRRRSYKGRPWKPYHWECELFDRLDDVLRESPDYKVQNRLAIQRPFPDYNDFAAKLKETLLLRDRNRLRERRPFRDIDDRLADKFIDFCTDPEAWIRFLHENGVKKPLLGPEGMFYRTAAYQCLEFFEHSKGMQRLVESTYAACECEREDADGRYGRSALAELPFAYETHEEEQVAAETVIKMELIPVGSRLTTAVAPGIGEVLAATRAHQVFRDTQDTISSLGTTPDAERRFNEAWQNLCSVVEDNWARKMVRRKTVDCRIADLCVGIYLALRVLGFVVFHGPKGFDWPLLAEEGIKNRIEHWVPELSRSVRALARVPAIHKQLVSAATLRCERATQPRKRLKREV